jgi:hypothetical protein
VTAFADLSEYINRATGGNSGTPESLWHWIDGRIQGAAATTPVAGRFTSLWRYNKSNGANGAIPGAVAAPTRATLGALGQSNPGGGRQRWLSGIEGFCNTSAAFCLYDRLLHIGGLSGIVTTAQTVGGALTRHNSNATCIGNQIAAEIYAQIGATATTITASYTNQAGVAGRITQAVVFGGTGAREAERMIILPLADGDTGVQAVASVTVAATTGTAGNFGVTVIRPLAENSIAVGLPAVRSFIAELPPMPEALPDACLAWMAFQGAATVINAMLCAPSVER